MSDEEKETIREIAKPALSDEMRLLRYARNDKSEGALPRNDRRWERIFKGC